MAKEVFNGLNCPNCLRIQSVKLKRSRNSTYYRYECDYCGTRVMVPKEEK